MVESPSSESLSSLSRWGAADHEDEVVSMSSTQEGENFAVGEAIENLIEKLNGTPRSEDSDESIRALLRQAVAAGGSNLRENMALYFVTKRGLEFGMDREAIDKIIEDEAEAIKDGINRSVEVPSATPASAANSTDGIDEEDLPDLVPDIVDDLLAVTMSKGGTSRLAQEDSSTTRAGSGALLPPPEQLEPGAIATGGATVVKAAAPPPSSRAGSLQ